MQHVRDDMSAKGREVLAYMEENGCHGIVLAGRPYHTDPEINHGIPELINNYGMAVLTDELKTSQHIDGAQAIVSSNLLTHIHRDDSFNHHRVSRHLAMLHTLATNVVQQQHTSLVTRQQFIIDSVFHMNFFVVIAVI